MTQFGVASMATLSLLSIACASVPGDPDGSMGPNALGELAGAVRLDSGSAALMSFEPARQPVLDGGECRVSELPAEGARRLTVVFPSFREPDTSIAMILGDGDRILRYSETRGVPRGDTGLEALRTQLQSSVRTQIQLDFVTGHAIAMNLGGDQPGSGVRGTTADFEGSPVGDLSGRMDLVRRLCASSEPR